MAGGAAAAGPGVAALGQRTKWLGDTGAGTRLALDAADRPLPLVEAVRDRWAELDDAGLGGLDVTAARHGLDKPDAAAR
jgi:hypothetical protein